MRIFLISVDRLAEQMRGLFVSTNEPTYRITALIGITEYRKGEGIHTAMERVDRALYNARRTGRNKIIITV